MTATPTEFQEAAPHTRAPLQPPTGVFTEVPGGLTLHHFEAGSGAPVVFIHGSGPGASGFSNFKHNYPQFAAAGQRAIVVDLPGYGASSKPADVQYTLDFFVSALRAQLTANGIGRSVRARIQQAMDAVGKSRPRMVKTQMGSE